MDHSFEIIEDGRLLKELNSACEKGDIPQVRRLIHLIPPSSSLLKFSYRPPLFWACKAGKYDTVKVLIEEYHCDPKYVTERGHTLVHVACARGHVEVARYLAKQHEVDPNKANGDGATPLLAACYNGHVDTVALLIDELKCDPYALGEHNGSLLHLACRNGHTEIAKLLVKKYGFDPMIRNSVGETPLHIASSKGRLAIGEYLLDELKCPVEVYDKDSSTPLHNACRNGQIDIIKHLVDGHKCSLKRYNNSGSMPFHVACRYGRKDVIKLLLERGFDPNTPNLSGETPIEIARDKGTITELIKKGARTDGVNLDMLGHYRDQHPLDSSVHLLVIGHETSGKSTIVQALQTSVSVSARLLRILGPCLVEGVTPHTAGIVPISFTSPEFGKVLVFDFAGQYDYHPSHAAVLEHSKTSSAPLFLLVVNLLDLYDIAKRRINYWINFVETNPIPGANQPHAIVLASHRDKLKKLYPKEFRAEISALESFTHNRFKSSKITLDGFFALDCREVSSDKHAQLRQQLKQSCTLLRSNIGIDALCHVLMVFLLKEFRGELSCTIEEVSDKIKPSEYPLPMQAERLCELAEALSTRTEILFIRHKLCPRKSWILLQMDSFLSKIHGRIFAPKKDFDSPNSLEASQAGVVQWSQLRNCFTDFPDPNLVVAFLGHFEECKVIDDPEVLSLIDPRRPTQLTLPSDYDDDDDVEADSPRLTGLPRLTSTPVLFSPPLGSLPTPTDKDGLEAHPIQTHPQNSKAPRQRGLTQSVDCHPPASCSPVGPSQRIIRSETMPGSRSAHQPEKYLFIPGLINADTPGPGVWIGRGGFTLCSGWMLQCVNQDFFGSRFLQALLLRLTFGFAVSQTTSRIAFEPNRRDRRECTIWKNGLRWLDLDGIETILEFVEDRKSILLLMRAKEWSEMKCVRLRSALIQKILEAKSDYCPDLVTSEYLIDPIHLEGKSGYPVITEPLSALKKYDVSTVAEAFVTRSHYVYDTNRVDHITIDKLVYFDSYNGVNQSVLCKLYDHQKQSNVLTQDLLQDFSFCHPNGAEKFKEILISRTYPTVSMDRLLSCHDNPCLQVLFRYYDTDIRNVEHFRKDLDTHSLFAGRNILEVQHSMSPVSDLTGKRSLSIFCHY